MGSSMFNIDCAVSTLEKIYVLAILSNTKLHFVGHTVNHTWKKPSWRKLSELFLAIVTAFSSSTAYFWKQVKVQSDFLSFKAQEGNIASVSCNSVWNVQLFTRRIRKLIFTKWNLNLKDSALQIWRLNKTIKWAEFFSRLEIALAVREMQPSSIQQM